ncbi:MAG: hypothetical protein ACI9Y1_000471 [Lentisphaeria bacterium]
MVVAVLGFILFLLIDHSLWFMSMLNAVDPERKAASDFSHHGLGNGETFAFWPMLFGGFFLYLSYYGCDQSQAQIELCAKNMHVPNKALFINGLLRFPLVALYCLVGIGIAV